MVSKNKYFTSDVDFLIEEVCKMLLIPPKGKISEYAQENRVLPINTPFPGQWDNDKTPYTIEPMDCMGMDSPITQVAVMKGVQLGLTAAAENIIAYYIRYPAEQLMISATETLIENWATNRLDPTIDSCNLRHLIQAQTENKGSRRTGDKILIKEYTGGTLNMASAQSASSLRSDSKKVIILDEIDGAPAQLRTGEGNFVEVAKARTSAYGDRKKVFMFTTPTTEEKSLIKVYYEEGDQRKYMVPCPFCSELQELVFGDERTAYGIKPIYDETKTLLDAYYECKHCHESIYNHHKTEMLKSGEWKPTAKSLSPNIRSYHISSLYSPVGMYCWRELWEDYKKALTDPEGMRSFVTLRLGLPFKETGSKPKLEKIIDLKGGYHQKEVPEGVIYLVAGIDVQQGSKTDKNNPPRLEMEILGIGEGYRTWSIAYLRFEGEIFDPFAGAWEDFRQFVMDGGWEYFRKDGRKLDVKMGLVDSGDGNVTDIVYRFTAGWSGLFPCKGFNVLKKRKGETGKTDEMNDRNFIKNRYTKLDNDNLLYQVATNYYKTMLYNNLKIEKSFTGNVPAGFCSFPEEYNEKYFKMLTAEEKRSDGSFHCPSGTRNEGLDCRVYALCVSDIYLALYVQMLRDRAKEMGATKQQIEEIRSKTALERLKNEIYVQPTQLIEE